jgi:hypothetical protein
MRDIEFITDFATKKKGDKWKCDSQLASQLVNVEKVAKYVKPKEKQENQK